MDDDADLETLIARDDHVNVLRYVRVHQLREPKLVIAHGKAAVKKSLDDLTRLAVYEQLALAAIDIQNHSLSEDCLAQLRKHGIEKDSVRFRLLLARCLEADNNDEGAMQIYDTLLTENPANSCALKRKYCILKKQVGQEIAATHALNEYLQSNYSDTAAWFEMAKLRMERGDFAKAIYALEEVLMTSPADSFVHTLIAECYATVGDIDGLSQARKHFCQALELESSNRRAQFGLVVAANSYLEAAANATKKQQVDDFELEVANELVKFGAEQVVASYKGAKMLGPVKLLMKGYTESE